MEVWTFEEEWTEPRGAERRRRPLGWMALAVVAGTAAGVSVDFPSGWVLAAALAGVLGLFVRVGCRWTGWAMLAVLAAMSAVHARQETREGSDAELGRLLRRSGEYVAFEAVALEDAAWRPGGAHRASAGIFRARLEAVNRKGTWERCGGEIRVNLHGAEAGSRMPRYGERWRMRGVATAGREYRSGLFGMERNEAVVSPERAECVGEGEGGVFRTWCWGRRRACRAALSRGLEGHREAAGVLQALILGYREDLPEGLRADFAATGTIHIFAISGAHVGMACVLLNLFLRGLMVPKTRRFWVVAPLLAVYVTMTGMATSAVRAAVMAGSFSLAPALRRRSDPLTGLGLAAMVILLASPGQVADVGFLMSFSAVWGILTLAPPLERALSPLWKRDPWKLALHEEEGQSGEPLWMMPVHGLTMGVAVWVASLPLTLRVFQLFSPVALPMNVLVIPSALGILTAGVASLAVSWTGAVGAWIGATFNLGGAVLADALTGAIRWTAGLEWGHAYVAPPPWWGVVAWMAAVAVGGGAWRRGRRWAPWALGAVLFAMAAGWWAWEATRVQAWALGAAPGQALLVQSGTTRVMIDAGPNFRATPVNRQLRELGANRLAAMVLSHPDAAHTGGAEEVLAEHPAAELWVPARRWRVPSFEAWLAAKREGGMAVRELRQGDEGDWGDVHWEALWPPEDLPMACADDACLLLRLSRGTNAVLVAGDFGGAQEAAYLRGAGWRAPAAGTLVLGRHGGADASSEAWLDAVGARVAVASCANGKNERQPAETTVERLAARGMEFIRAELDRATRVPGL